MIVAVADTHTIIWYLNADERLSSSARFFIENVAKDRNQIGISSITLIEMVYLIERSRISSQMFSLLSRELNEPNALLAEIPVDLKIARTMARIEASVIPEMPDRIIAAAALVHNVPLITRDHKIQQSNLKTIW